MFYLEIHNTTIMSMTGKLQKLIITEALNLEIMIKYMNIFIIKHGMIMLIGMIV